MIMREYEKLFELVGNVKGFLVDGKYFLDGVPDVPNSKRRLVGALKALQDLEIYLRGLSVLDEHRYQIEEENKSEKEVTDGV